MSAAACRCSSDLVVERWDAAFPAHSGPFGLAGWQAAFLVVGLPGLLLALVVATLREPMRGLSETVLPDQPEASAAGFVQEVLTIIPPFSLIGAARRGPRALFANIAVIGLVTAIVLLLVLGFEEPVAQWAAVGAGVYSIYSWGGALRTHDRPTFSLTFGSRAFNCVVLSYGLVAFLSYAVSAFAASHARRSFGLSADEVGLWVGLPAAAGGFIGLTLGGRIADTLRSRHAAGRIAVLLAGTIVPVIFVVPAFLTQDATHFFILNILYIIAASSALGAAAATTQDLVLPRMRGSATAIFFVGTTLLGLALGPYLAGRISALTGDLATGILSLLVSTPIACIAAILAWRWAPAAEARREAMALGDASAI